MRNKYASFPLTMAILAFLCFLFIVFLMSTAVQPLWGQIGVLPIPALVLGGVGLLALKGMLNSKKTAVLTVFLSVIFLLASICYTFFLLIWTATTDTTDVQYYPRAYAQIKNGNGIMQTIGPFTIRIPPGIICTGMEGLITVRCVNRSIYLSNNILLRGLVVQRRTGQR